MSWGLVHIQSIVQLRPIPLPWSIDNALGAIMFIYIGDMFKRYKFRLWHISFCILPIAFWCYCRYVGFDYVLNMKSMRYEHLLLDLFVPLSFTYTFYLLSFVLCHVKYFSHVLTYIGKCSITIFFVHALVLGFCQKLSLPWAVSLSVGASCFLHYVFERNRYTRVLFIGK